MSPRTPITLKDIGKLGIDEKNNLYYGEVRLTPEQNRLAKAVAVAAIVASLGTIANAAASWITLLKRLPSTSQKPIARQSSTTTTRLGTLPRCRLTRQALNLTKAFHLRGLGVG
jgi:hypothetical protein